MNILYDYHLHSDFSGDCETPAKRMAEHALALGLHGICFTEHLDLDAPMIDDIDFTFDAGLYFRKMQNLKELFQGKLEIRVGVELGMQPHMLADADQFASQWPFDFVIASQHYINGQDPYYPSFFEGRNERQCYEEFFKVQYDLMRRLSRWNTLGHMDYIVRYGPTQNTNYSFKAYADYIDPILRYLIENGKCLEVNTGGFKYGLGQPNPASDVLARYRELGGELITVGSDAHTPEYLAYDFDRAAALLAQLGFRYYTIFREGKACMIPLVLPPA